VTTAGLIQQDKSIDACNQCRDSDALPNVSYAYQLEQEKETLGEGFSYDALCNKSLPCEISAAGITNH
jgi:hypothetical protein